MVIFYNKMVILFDTLLILLFAAVLENCLETAGLKPFRTSRVKLRCLLFFQLESFLIGKSQSLPHILFKLRRLSSLFDFLLVPVLFVGLFHLNLFVTIANVVDSVYHVFFLLSECHLLFTCMDCHTCPSIFKWNCPT